MFAPHMGDPSTVLLLDRAQKMGHRVLRNDGTVSPGFRWIEMADGRDVVEVLREEGSARCTERLLERDGEVGEEGIGSGLGELTVEVDRLLAGLHGGLLTTQGGQAVGEVVKRHGEVGETSTTLIGPAPLRREPAR